MAGSSTAELRLRPTREDDLDYVVAAEADPDNAPFLAPSPREEHCAHRLWLDVKPRNERALSLYRSAGFVEEGLLRDALYNGGRFESLIVMSILRPEWNP